MNKTWLLLVLVVLVGVSMGFVGAPSTEAG